MINIMDDQNNSKPKILFILDKWCAGNINFGVSAWETNFWQSLDTVGLAEFDLFHFDEYFRVNGKKGDEAVLKKIDEFKPQLICLVLYRMPGSANNVPTFETLEKIKNVRKIPMFTIWGDLEIIDQVKISESIDRFVDFHIFTALSSVFNSLRFKDKYAYFWVPKDPRYFFNDNRNRDIDISYVGSPKPDRLNRLNWLVKNGIDVKFTGGEREVHLSTEAYSDLFRRSKISLSFSRSRYHVINARPFEVTLCGSLLLEQESIETVKLFTPFIDYVPFSSNKDLLEKCQYYINHDDARNLIANSGHNKSVQFYSARRFWDIVFKKAGLFTCANGETNEKEYICCGSDNAILDNWGKTTLVLKDDYVKLVPKKWRFKYKILEFIASKKALYRIYGNVSYIFDGYAFRFKLALMIYKFIKRVCPANSVARLDKLKKYFYI
ncbi:MAG: glycosyltransferase [Patescibacteria group bacterium]